MNTRQFCDDCKTNAATEFTADPITGATLSLCLSDKQKRVLVAMSILFDVFPRAELVTA